MVQGLDGVRISVGALTVRRYCVRRVQWRHSSYGFVWAGTVAQVFFAFDEAADAIYCIASASLCSSEVPSSV
jgi:hypothetical protein